MVNWYVFGCVVFTNVWFFSSTACDDCRWWNYSRVNCHPIVSVQVYPKVIWTTRCSLSETRNWRWVCILVISTVCPLVCRCPLSINQSNVEIIVLQNSKPIVLLGYFTEKYIYIIQSFTEIKILPHQTVNSFELEFFSHQRVKDVVYTSYCTTRYLTLPKNCVLGNCLKIIRYFYDIVTWDTLSRYHEISPQQLWYWLGMLKFVLLKWFIYLRVLEVSRNVCS